MEEIELYRVCGYFDQLGLHTEKVIKYFPTKKHAQRAIKEERKRNAEDYRVDLFMDKIVLKNGKKSFVKLLNKEVNILLEHVDHFPPSKISNGEKQFGRIDHIHVRETIEY